MTKFVGRSVRIMEGAYKGEAGVMKSVLDNKVRVALGDTSVNVYVPLSSIRFMEQSTQAAWEAASTQEVEA